MSVRYVKLGSFSLPRRTLLSEASVPISSNTNAPTRQKCARVSGFAEYLTWGKIP